MKMIILLLLMICTVHDQYAFGVMSHHISSQKNIHRLIIHFAADPDDSNQHIQWNQTILEAQKELNDFLQKRYFTKQNIAHGCHENVIRLLLRTIKEWWYSFLYPEASLYEPYKKNEVLFVRIDHDFGNFALQIPEEVSEDLVIQRLHDILHSKGVHFYIDKDVAVRIAQLPDVGLEGVALTLSELEAVKRAQRHCSTKEDATVLTSIDAKTKKLPEIINQSFWHHRIPTTGLRLEAPFYPLCYPYIPHMFSLWQLAPKKGEGVRVAIIDTGVSAASLHHEPQYKKNHDLTFLPEMLHRNLNIVSHNGLDPIEQLVNVAYPYLEPHSFNEVEISQEIIRWVHDYLQNKQSDKIVAYLKQRGKKELFDDAGNLTPQGKKAIADITSGPYGIAPERGKPSLQLVHMQEPFHAQVIKQLLPLAPVSNRNVTYIAGHGSHTYGLVAGTYNGVGDSPEDDVGICGIAPQASVFMIKAFKDDGTSDKSTLIAGLKKAILYNADIVNLSLKIADTMDVTATLSKLLEKMVELIPYVVAASGNGGDPRLPGYVGNIEAYPARFKTVAFDVGSFSFHNDRCSLSSFSQYEEKIGPKFVAPGCNIMSSALVPGQQEDSMYVFMNGTSMAAPLMTGFVALMLAEFQNDFTREELLNICYTSVFRMHNEHDWHHKVLLGVLDMRTALFVMHVVRESRKQQCLKNISFNKLLLAVYEIIFAQPKAFSKRMLKGIDFSGDFMTYFAKACMLKVDLKKEGYFIPENLNEAVEYVVHSLVETYTPVDVAYKAEPQVIQRVAHILRDTQDPDLFSHFSPEIKNRLVTVQRQKDYWQEQANRIKNSLMTRKDLEGLL